MTSIKVGFNHVALIDDEDHTFVGKFTWEPFFSKRGPVYAMTTIHGQRAFLHKVVTGGNYSKIEFINGNVLDCRKANLKGTTKTQRRKRKLNVGKSGYRGVSFDTNKGNWKSQIIVGNTNKYIGRFGTKEEAALAYDKVAIAIFGELAQLNFPEERHEKLETGLERRVCT